MDPQYSQLQVRLRPCQTPSQQPADLSSRPPGPLRKPVSDRLQSAPRAGAHGPARERHATHRFCFGLLLYDVCRVSRLSLMSSPGADALPLLSPLPRLKKQPVKEAIAGTVASVAAGLGVVALFNAVGVYV